MKNSQIAAVFRNIVDLLEIKGENKFKIRAYQRALQAIENLPQEIEDMLDQGMDLRNIPGVGDAIARKITELVQTGKLQYYENLKAEFPEGITSLLAVPGLGPKTARKLSDAGINTIDELENALVDGRVFKIQGMGEKVAENLLRQIQNLRRKDKRMPIGEALPIVDDIINYLKDVPGIKNLTSAGSLRRFKDTIGDIDLMGTADNPQLVIDKFVNSPFVYQVLAHGPTKASVIIDNDIQVDLRLVEHDSFGSLLQYFTGSKQHNILLRTRAQKLGLKLSEYGITQVDTEKMEKFADEEEFYNRLGLQYIPPEIREAQGEIELAEQHGIPKLVELDDIRGDLHVHTEWSDGTMSIEEIAEAARDIGYEYLLIADHSSGLGIAHGLNVERLKQQINVIKEINKSLNNFRILSGIEVDIRADGSLDLPEEILNELDIVVAAMHSALNQNEVTMTNRIIKALQNPAVDILAHPTCRLIGVREAVAVDIETVLKVAAEYKKVLEINAMPSRLDLKDVHIKRAKELGVKLSIGTDAHNSAQLRFMRFGIGTARRGWCSKSDIINSWNLEKVLEYLNK